jgi:tetratricopeptide (TPR) repeat protein
MSLLQPFTWDLQVSRLHENVDQSSSCRTAGQSLGTNQQIDVRRSDEVGNTSNSPPTPDGAEDGSLRERASAGLQLTKASWEGKRDKPESFSQQNSGKASKTFQQDGSPHPQDHHESDPKAQLAKGPANASEVIAYADLLRSRGKVAEAMSLYDCVLAVDPRSADALVGKGACLQQQAQPRAAFACFVGALALNPANVQALSRCGIFYTEEGHLLEGIEVSLSR